jgi:CRP-like cAMP-binding protein
VRILGEVTTGDLVGHDAVMRSRTYASSVIATEACSFYAVNRSDLVALLKDQPGIALELQTALGLSLFFHFVLDIYCWAVI